MKTLLIVLLFATSATAADPVVFQARSTHNGRPAKITGQYAGVADWTITLDIPSDGRFLAQALDGASNAELIPHELSERIR